MQRKHTPSFRQRARVILVMCTWMFGVFAAEAHTSPSGCNGNGVLVNMARSPAFALVGSTVTYTVGISNLDDQSIGLVACDAEDVDVFFYCPAADGTPDFGNPQVLSTNLSLPAGTPAFALGGMLTCTLNVNAGVFDAVALVRAGDQSGALDDPTEGRIHDGGVDDIFRSEKELGTEVITTTTSTSTSSSTSSSTTSTTTGSTTSTTSALIGCRITGGFILPDGGTDDSGYMGISKGTGGGQVGASCGCIGCFDDGNHIRGQWQYTRKNSQGPGNLGTFHASDFYSLMCGCDDGMGGPGIIGTGPGNTMGLCNPDGGDAGPQPRPSPANVACWTGVGTLSPPSLGKRTTPVAFRVQVEDRGEPGAGKNAGTLSDVYHIEIWIPTGNETPDSLAKQACCFDPDPTLRTANIDDGGNLNKGNIQIHPETPGTDSGTCPPPPQSGSLCSDRIAP